MNFLYQIFIYPIESSMNWLLGAIYAHTESHGFSIILLSLLVNLVLLPLYYIAEQFQIRERKIQSQLQPKLQEFGRAFSGEQRFMMIRTLYRQHGYHPIHSLRASFGFLIQVPFFIAAYHLLSNYSPFEGASFFTIVNLNKPDGLLNGINLLPCVMTGFNLASAFVNAKQQFVNEKNQHLFIALLFLVILYSSPAALVIYWTFNNMLSLLRKIAYSHFTTIQDQRVGDTTGTFPGSQISCDASNKLRSMPLKLAKKLFAKIIEILQSPYGFAFMIGVFPVSFYLSNNWHMFVGFPGFRVFGLVALIIFMGLSVFYAVSNWCLRKFAPSLAHRYIPRLFIFVSLWVLAYILRATFMPFLGYNYITFLLIVAVVAWTVAWLIPVTTFFRVNMVLLCMIIWHAGITVYEISTKGQRQFLSFVENRMGSIHAQSFNFLKTPNIYYIVPDGYPNSDALKNIFDLENKEWFHDLENQGFRLYPKALSNYQATVSSIASTFGMTHHFYSGMVGNLELLGGRKFIASDANPVVSILKSQGYKVGLVHETGARIAPRLFR